MAFGAVVLAAEKRARFELANIVLKLRKVAREIGADVLALSAELEQHFDVGLAAGKLVVGLDDLLQPFACLKDLLGRCGIVPEVGIGDLLFYLVELPALERGVKENSAVR